MHFNPVRANYGFEQMRILPDYYREMARLGGPQAQSARRRRKRDGAGFRHDARGRNA